MIKNTFIFVLFLMSSSCSNIFEEVAKKDTEASVYYEAKQKLSARDYTTAINLLQSLGAPFLAQREVALVYASAYSGRCGLEFVSLVEDLSNIGSSVLFSFLLQSFVGGTDSKIADCLSSESIINALGVYSSRTSDENVLIGFSSLAKIGTVLSRYADLDGDGVTDASFNHCSTTDFPDAAVREIGTGMANSILSISAVASDISSGALQDITQYCGLDPNLNVFCTNTEASAYSTLEVAVLRQLLGSTDLGVGYCGNFTDLACVCP